jgi:broad specificity phosphatase PhoE
VLRLTLVRHGSTEWNETGRFQGWGDPPLSAKGRAEAAHLHRVIGGERFDRVVTSDLVRARETAAIAPPRRFRGNRPAPARDELGTWDGLTWTSAWRATAT